MIARLFAVLVVGAIGTASVDALATPSYGARVLTASDLERLCTKSKKQGQNECAYYILGATEGLSEGMSQASNQPIACGGDATLSDLVAVVVSEMKRDFPSHPEERKLAAMPFVMEALFHHYRCSPPPKP